MSPRNWPDWLRTTAWWVFGVTLALSVGFAGIGSYVVWRHTRAILGEEHVAQQVRERNHFYLMLAGVDQNDGSEVGNFAAALRVTMTGSSDPAQSLLHFYVRPGQYPDINNILGVSVINYEQVTDDSGDTSSLDQGYVSKLFLGDAWQATPANVSNLLAKPRAPEQLGLLNWNTDLYTWPVPLGLGIVLLLGMFLGFPIVAELKERRLLAAAPPSAREVRQVIRQLERSDKADDYYSPVYASLQSARRLYEWLTQDVPHARAEADIKSKLRELQTQLDQIKTAEAEGLRVYQELERS